MNLHKLFQIPLTVILALSAWHTTANPVFKELEDRCNAVPSYRQLYYNNEIYKSSQAIGTLVKATNYSRFKLVSLETFEKTIDLFFQTMQGCLENSHSWFGDHNHLERFLNPNRQEFLPYAQKVVVNPETTVMLKGDLHGDIHSLVAFTRSLQEQGYTCQDNPLKICDPNFRLIFLGDYVDRGLWGTEVLYLLMLLKIHNPTQVFLVRGNHEDPQVAEVYGFKHEFINKFAQDDQEKAERCYGKLSKLYDYLPCVLYLGSGTKTSTDFIQCCHGGVEFGFNPQDLLQAPEIECFQRIASVNRLTECKHFSHCTVMNSYGATRPVAEVCTDFIPLSPTYPSHLGFLWHDFIVSPSALSLLKPGRGFACNKELTHATLKAASSPTKKLVAIIRAHQHAPDDADPMMKLLLESHGCAVLWEKKENGIAWGSVFTLLLSPDSLSAIPNVGGKAYTGFSYDTSLLLKTGSTLPQWSVTVLNKEVYAQQYSAL